MQTCACVPHPLHVDLRSRDKVTTPHFCVPDAMTQFSGWCSYCGPEDSHNVTQGVTREPSQAILFLFFFFQSMTCRNRRPGEMCQSLSRLFVAVVLYVWHHVLWQT